MFRRGWSSANAELQPLPIVSNAVRISYQTLIDADRAARNRDAAIGGRERLARLRLQFQQDLLRSVRQRHIRRKARLAGMNCAYTLLRYTIRIV